MLYYDLYYFSHLILFIIYNLKVGKKRKQTLRDQIVKERREMREITKRMTIPSPNEVKLSNNHLNLYYILLLSNSI